MILEGFTDISSLLRPAIYILLRDGEVMYVGKSKHPLFRIQSHKNQHLYLKNKKKSIKTVYGKRYVKEIPFNEIKLLPCDEDKLDETEIALIKQLNPRYNYIHKPTPEPTISFLRDILNLPSPEPELPPLTVERRI